MRSMKKAAVGWSSFQQEKGIWPLESIFSAGTWSGATIKNGTQEGGRMTQLMLFTEEEMGVPIPECSTLALEKYGTPERVARLTLEAARRWQRQHPKDDVMEVISPDWREYVKANL